jgi:hypothetical protein
MRFQPVIPVVAVSLFVLACEGDSTAPDQSPRPSGAADAGQAVGDVGTASAASPTTNLVFTKTTTGECSDGDMSQTLTLNQKSRLLVSFTFEWGGLEDGEEGLLSPSLDGGFATFEWGFVGHTVPRTSGTVTWSFTNVPRGSHTVAFNARVEGGDEDSGLNECALTVIVVP